MKRWMTTILILCLVCLACRAEDKLHLRVVSYNVENLFDCRHDTLKNDSDYLENGIMHWSIARYREKLHHIAQVICGIGGWEAPALVGLMEVENDSCLSDLCRYHLRKNIYPYRYIHYESPDVRGVDVALLYDSTKLRCIHSEAIRIPTDRNQKPTRDILYAEMGMAAPHHTENISGTFSIHCYICHLPSQLAGTAATAERRQQVIGILQEQVDSILVIDSTALIVVMGDFNMQAEDNIRGLQNLMLPYKAQEAGTHKYHGEWSCLDQYYVSERLLQMLTKPELQEPMHKDLQADSPAVIYAPEWLLENDETYLGARPNRTYIGPRYHKGYSDHLPIVLDIEW